MYITGSAYGANQSACYALLATQIATSVSALMWMLTEWGVRKQPSILGTYARTSVSDYWVFMCTSMGFLLCIVS